MDKAMKKTSRITSTLKLVLSTVIDLSASPVFANYACPEGSIETLITSSDLPSFDGQSYYTSRKITFQGNEYDCLRPEQLNPSVSGGGYALREKCGPFYSVNFGQPEIIIKAKDGTWYNFRYEYDYNQTSKSVSKCNAASTYCNSYNVSSRKLFKNQGVSDVISQDITTAYLFKCSKPPTF